MLLYMNPMVTTNQKPTIHVQNDRKTNGKKKSATNKISGMKHANVPTFACQRERRGLKMYMKKLTENFPNLKKETDIQVQEAQRISNKMNPNRPTPRHIILKWQKLKIKKEF